MTNKVEVFKRLYDEGIKYDYINSSSKGEYGYPEAFDEHYTSWQLRTEMILAQVFGHNTPIFNRYLEHKECCVIGNGNDEFNRYHKCIISALKAGIDTLEFDHTLITDEIDITNEKLNHDDVFIVHGHDEKMKQEVEILVTEFGLNPIVLHRQADEGMTIIEKFEKNSQVGYAIILLTPDDICYSKDQDELTDKERSKGYRARQNVIFEFGYFIGKLGRNRVCCLYKESTEIPTDISGLIYKKVTSSVEEIAFSLIKDLKSVGLSVNI